MTKARVVIENITPEVESGRFPARRVLGEDVLIEADLFADGHDAVAASVLYRHEGDARWHSAPMRLTGNDRWAGHFTAETLGRYLITIEAWVDHLESWPRESGSEEYLDSEKYQIRFWNREDPASLRELITRLNRIRRENTALQSNTSLKFHEIDNEALIAYSKTDSEGSVLVVVNVGPHHAQTGWVQLDVSALGVSADMPFQVDDLLSGARFLALRTQLRGARPGDRPGARLQGTPSGAHRAGLRLFPVISKRGDGNERTSRAAAGCRSSLVQGRRHLRSPRPCVLRQQR